jgi:hypothetical protein
MADITQAVEQQAIADSILDDSNIVGSWKAEALAEEPIPTQEEAAEPDVAEQFITAEAERRNEQKLANLSTDRERPEREQSQPEHEAQPEAQPQEPTPEQVRETVQALDNFNEQHQLSDDLRTKEFCLGLAELGQPISSTDQAELGKGLDRLALSALQTAEATPGEFPSVSRAAAAELCFSVLPALGVDPRGPNVNQEYVANVLHGAAVNFHRTAQAVGTDDVRRLNDPAMVQWTFWHLAKGFGTELEWPLSPQNRSIAMALADRFGDYLLSYRGKVAQNYHSQEQPASRRGNSGQRQTTGSRYRTNQDLFTNETEERLANEQTGRRRGGNEFSPKARAKRSQFQTNNDPGSPFNDESMEIYRQQSGRL